MFGVIRPKDQQYTIYEFKEPPITNNEEGNENVENGENGENEIHHDENNEEDYENDDHNEENHDNNEREEKEEKEENEMSVYDMLSAFHKEGDEQHHGENLPYSSPQLKSFAGVPYIEEYKTFD